jgi:hypothetical protein
MGQAGQHGVLLRLEFLAGGEAILDVDRLAQRVLLGQQESGQRTPARQLIDLGCQWRRPVHQHTIAQLRGGKTCQRHPRCLPVGIEQGFDLRQFLGQQFVQGRANGRLRIVEISDRAPLFAPRQHGGEQVDQARRIVVHPGQHRRRRPRHARQASVLVIEMVEGAPRCLAVMAAGVLHRRRLGAKARQQGHLPRQAGAQGIDGGQAQTPRLLLDGQSRCAERASAARARSKVTRLCGASGGTPCARAPGFRRCGCASRRPPCW